MQVATRRNLLLGTAGVAAFSSMGQLSSCSSTPNNNVLPAVIDAITKAITGACSVIPAVTTLVDIIVKAFPQAAGVATITDAVAQQIATYVCGLFAKAGAESAPEGANLSATVQDASIPLHGYRVTNGKLVAF